MNEHFVPIKVDREERPDVDSIYMEAVQGMTGHGGWPLTAFCDPEGVPFYGGTYFPPEPRQGMPSFRMVMEAVAQSWATQREQISGMSAKIRDQLGAVGRIEPAEASSPGPWSKTRSASCAPQPTWSTAASAGRRSSRRRRRSS